MTVIEKQKQRLIDNIAELNGYLNNDEYDDLEQHDIKIAIDTYKSLLSVLEALTDE